MRKILAEIICILLFISTTTTGVSIPWEMLLNMGITPATFVSASDAVSAPIAEGPFAGQYVPAIRIINVDTQNHLTPGGGQAFNSYKDVKGANFRNGDWIHFRFKLQAIGEGSILSVFLQNVDGRFYLCSRQFEDENPGPFNLKIRCEVPSTGKFYGKYRVAVEILFPNGSRISRFWGYSDASYNIVIDEAEKEVRAKEMPASDDKEWGTNYKITVLSESLQKPDASRTQVIPQKHTYEFNKLNPGFAVKLPLKNKPDSISGVPPTIIERKVTNVKLEISAPDPTTAEIVTICQSEMDAPMGIPTEPDSGKETSTIKCIPEGRDTGIEIGVREVGKDAVELEISEVKRPVDDIAKREVSNAEIISAYADYDDGDMLFSAMKTEGTLIVKTKKEDAKILVRNEGPASECISFSEPVAEKPSALNSLWKKLPWGRYEHRIKITYDPICQYPYIASPLIIEVVGESRPTPVLMHFVYSDANLLLVTSKKLVTDAKFEETLREFIKIKAEKDGLSSRFLVLDGKYWKEYGFTDDGEISDISEAKNMIHRLLDKFTYAKYLVILGGEDVVPMPAFEVGGEKFPNDGEYGKAIAKDGITVISRMPTAKGDYTSELVTKWLANSIENTKSREGKKKISIIGDACGGERCWIRKDTLDFAEQYYAAKGQPFTDCSNGKCSFAPNYCNKEINSGKACDGNAALKEELESSDFIAFITHGGGGTNIHAEDEKSTKYYQILTASDAKMLAFEKNPIMFLDGCQSGALDQVGDGGDWKKWQSKPATADRMVWPNLVTAGAAIIVASTRNVYSSAIKESEGVMEFAKALGSKNVRIGDAITSAKEKILEKSSLAVINHNLFQIYGDPTLYANYVPTPAPRKQVEPERVWEIPTPAV